MTDAKDVVRLHVEVATDEAANVKETQKLLSDIEKKLYKIKSSRTERKLFENPELFDFGGPIKTDTDKGPIFRGQEESEEASTVKRPGKKGQAVQRQDIFKNLQQRVEDVETKQTDILSQLEQLSPFLILSGGAKGMGAQIMTLIRPIIPYIAEALIAFGFIETVFNMLFGEGGPFDRRFKLILNNYVSKWFSRQQLQSIRQGFTQLRISSWISPRGNIRGQANTTLSGINHGRPVYNDRLEMLTKDLY